MSWIPPDGNPGKLHPKSWWLGILRHLTLTGVWRKSTEIGGFTQQSRMTTWRFGKLTLPVTWLSTCKIQRWKMIRSFFFGGGGRPIFRGELVVSGSVMAGVFQKRGEAHCSCWFAAGRNPYFFFNKSLSTLSLLSRVTMQLRTHGRNE